jgi:hypothetical protein
MSSPTENFKMTEADCLFFFKEFRVQARVEAEAKASNSHKLH